MRSKSRRFLGRGALSGCVVAAWMGFVGCRAPRPPEAWSTSHLVAEEARLAGDLLGLGPRVAKAEAQRAARVIVQTVEDARVTSRLQGGAVRRNLAINLGLHEWGLCWHWTELLGRRLKEENLHSLHLRWACAHAGSTLREHNAVVITAQGRPLAEGLVVDPWRKGGVLTWMPVGHDRYPWKHEPWSEARWLSAPPQKKEASPSGGEEAASQDQKFVTTQSPPDPVTGRRDACSEQKSAVPGARVPDKKVKTAIMGGEGSREEHVPAFTGPTGQAQPNEPGPTGRPPHPHESMDPGSTGRPTHGQAQHVDLRTATPNTSTYERPGPTGRPTGAQGNALGINGQ